MDFGAILVSADDSSDGAALCSKWFAVIFTETSFRMFPNGIILDKVGMFNEGVVMQTFIHEVKPLPEPVMTRMWRVVIFIFIKTLLSEVIQRSPTLKRLFMF